jgi:hypothetical protein
MLLTRMNFAADLVANRLEGTRIESSRLRDNTTVARLVAPEGLSSPTKAVLAEADNNDRLALLFAAPEFQRR